MICAQSVTHGDRNQNRNRESKSGIEFVERLRDVYERCVQCAVRIVGTIK